jgi:choline-sulfatase
VTSQHPGNGRNWPSGLSVLFLLLTACSSPAPAPRTPSARNLILITIDTMRPDHVGAYGYGAARTPTLDRLAREGARFDRAFAASPITLTSHASLLTGRYPPGHGARDNGIAMNAAIGTLATWLHDQGFATGAFVAAFPLDHRFGLGRGFDAYGDRMPRGADGRLANERPAKVVVDEAIAWLDTVRQAPGGAKRYFLWVHFFEPHAPYGDPVRDRGRPPLERYDDEIAIADREAGRLLSSIGPEAGQTLVVAASDHGEAFGEHGETGHSLFVYDTTLRVALLMSGPGVPADRVVRGPVCLVDVAPTVLRLLGGAGIDADGIDLRPAIAGAPVPPRQIYAETFAPLLDFGWSPLRAVRDGRWKAIAAPRPELYDIDADAGEMRDLAAPAATSPTGSPPRGPLPLSELLARVDRYSGADLPASAGAAAGPAASARARLGALGYVQGGAAPASGIRPDPKDRRALAARIAAVTSGELQGEPALAALEAIVGQDPGNGQMQLRLGDALAGRSRCGDAAKHFQAAIEARLPSADPFIGLAACQSQAGRTGVAIGTLRQSQSVEADNPVVLANIGLLQGREGHVDAAAAALRQALAIDPDFHEARFNLALVFARAGRRADARAETEALLTRLPADAPQRSEVERLLSALR